MKPPVPQTPLSQGWYKIPSWMRRYPGQLLAGFAQVGEYNENPRSYRCIRDATVTLVAYSQDKGTASLCFLLSRSVKHSIIHDYWYHQQFRSSELLWQTPQTWVFSPSSVGPLKLANNTRTHVCRTSSAHANSRSSHNYSLLFSDISSLGLWRVSLLVRVHIRQAGGNFVYQHLGSKSFAWYQILEWPYFVSALHSRHRCCPADWG